MKKDKRCYFVVLTILVLFAGLFIAERTIPRKMCFTEYSAGMPQIIETPYFKEIVLNTADFRQSQEQMKDWNAFLSSLIWEKRLQFPENIGTPFCHMRMTLLNQYSPPERGEKAKAVEYEMILVCPQSEIHSGLEQCAKIYLRVRDTSGKVMCYQARRSDCIVRKMREIGLLDE